MQSTTETPQSIHDSAWIAPGDRAWDGPEYQKWLATMKTLVDADQDLR